MSHAQRDDESPEAYAERVISERQWPVTVALKIPIVFGSEHITSLEFRRGRAGDLKGIKPDSMPTVDQLLLIASRMCGQPIRVLEMLDADDSGEVMEIVLGFFAKFLGSGRKR